MANNKENDQQHQPGTGGDANDDRDRKEEFNELSELSLEERMNVADRMGIPVEDAGDAAATGAMSGGDDASGSPNDQRKEESTGEKTDL